MCRNSKNDAQQSEIEKHGKEASSELLCHLVPLDVSQAFQEDMATQQPNMDALNKVAL